MTLLVFPIRTSCVGCTFSLFTLSDLGCLTSPPFSAPKRIFLEANNPLPSNFSCSSLIYIYTFSKFKIGVNAFWDVRWMLGAYDGGVQWCDGTVRGYDGRCRGTVRWCDGTV